MNTLTNGMKIGKATVVVDIIKKGNPEIRPGTIIKPRFITYHNTGNKGKGANAKAHNTYIHNLASYHPKDTSHVSWQLSVDENFIYQHIPFNENAWHCGDGSGKNSGNMTSIGIEICEHVDQKDYHQAEENAIALGVYIAKALNIPIGNHVPHQKWSGKYCPRVILARDGNFTKFHNRIKVANSQVSAPKEPIKEVEKEMGQTLFTPSTNTFKNEFVSFLESAHKKGILSSHTWVEKAKSGTLSQDDAIALVATVINRSK